MNNSDEQAGIAEINKLHQELQELATGALDRAIRLGELLSSAKAGVPHGQWLAWLTSNVAFSERTARNYLRLFENRATLKSANVADLAEAYQMLVHQSQPAAETTPALMTQSQPAIRTTAGLMTKEEALRAHEAVVKTLDELTDVARKQYELQRKYPEILNDFPGAAATFELVAESRSEKEFRRHLIRHTLKVAELAEKADLRAKGKMGA